MPLTATSPSSENWLVAVGTVDPSLAMTSLQLDSGQIVAIPTSLLLANENLAGANVSTREGSIVIPVLEEELVVSKRQVPLETVRMTKTVETTTERQDVPLLREHFAVNRVPCEVEVSERSDARQEGDTTIYPVFEERTVTRKALFLVEEVHIQRVSETFSEHVEATLQRDVLSIERFTP